MILTDWLAESESHFLEHIIVQILQELKLQATKIRDGVVLSLYSRNKWFAKDISIF